MTFFKSFTTVAATAAIALGAALAGTAPAAANEVRTIVSDTWKPGFRNDGEGHYVRQVITDRDDSPRQVTRLETRESWAPGFQNNGEGQYARLAPSAQDPQGGSTSIAERDSWAPGYRLNDMSHYTRIVPNGGEAQTATMPDGAQ